MAPLILIAAMLSASPMDGGQAEADAFVQAIDGYMRSRAGSSTSCEVRTRETWPVPRSQRRVIEFDSVCGCQFDSHEAVPKRCPSAAIVGPDRRVTAVALLRDGGGEGGAFGGVQAQRDGDHYVVVEKVGDLAIEYPASSETATRFTLTPTPDGLFAAGPQTTQSRTSMSGHFRDEARREELDIQGNAKSDGKGELKTVALRILYTDPKQRAPRALTIVSVDWTKLEFVVRFPESRVTYRLALSERSPGSTPILTSQGDDGSPAQTFFTVH